MKNDSVCHPTWSFKDRVVSVAITKAREFGFDTVACASTGNLANSVAAHAAEGRLKSYIFIPADLEQGKVLATLVYNPTLVAVHGTYDEVNRLCSEIADKYRWAFVNVNFRPYYAEGSKTLRLRDRRAARVEDARAHRRALRRRLADHEDLQGDQGAEDPRPHRRTTAARRCTRRRRSAAGPSSP